MTRFFQEDLGRQLERIREAGRISTETVSRWSRLAADGTSNFIRARGL